MFGPEDKERLAAGMREHVEAGGQVASKVCFAAHAGVYMIIHGHTNTCHQTIVDLRVP